ncbi:MAG TPA: c-type cytochrome [Polyangiaceae bacterium]|nr:c-type cytochrome [Polyangiaceae bacterium]
MQALLRRAGFWLVVGTGLAFGLGCKSPSSGSPAPEKPRPAAPARARAAPVEVAPPAAFEPGNAEHGKTLVAQFECHRCHAGTGMAAPKLDQDCVGCHEQIATDKFQAASSKLAKWKPHVLPYRDVPSLTDLGARLRPAWVRDYLLHPHDLRPNLAQTMPRLALSPEQARDIATYLTASKQPVGAPIAVTPEPAQVAHGKELLTAKGCVSCHQVTGAGLSDPPKNDPVVRTLGLAPDLRFARQRAEPAVLVSWLLDPSKVKHDAAMPKLGLSETDARDLAAFLSFGELESPPQKPRLERLPVLERRVGFDEVNEQVFAVTCRHCHTNPDSAGGDGGPGNTGGFGFKPRKIDFSSYQGIQSGGVDAQGTRVSLFTPTSEGLPRLVAALVARSREDAGQESDEVRGMPLGLPPLSPTQIQLVESWVAQGRPL